MSGRVVAERTEQYQSTGGMSDEELYDEYAQCNSSIDDITQQIRDDLDGVRSRSAAWRNSAGKARRYIKVRRAELKVQIDRRVARVRAETAKLTAATNAAREERRKAEATNLVAAHDRTIAAKAARIQASQKRTSEQQDLFCMACAQIMGKEQYRAAWEKAREMFPDHPSWIAPV